MQNPKQKVQIRNLMSIKRLKQFREWYAKYA